MHWLLVDSFVLSSLYSLHLSIFRFGRHWIASSALCDFPAEMYLFTTIPPRPFYFSSLLLFCSFLLLFNLKVHWDRINDAHPKKKVTAPPLYRAHFKINGDKRHFGKESHFIVFFPSYPLFFPMFSFYSEVFSSILVGVFNALVIISHFIAFSMGPLHGIKMITKMCKEVVATAFSGLFNPATNISWDGWIFFLYLFYSIKCNRNGWGYYLLISHHAELICVVETWSWNYNLMCKELNNTCS